MKKFNFLMAILASVFALQLSWAQPGLYDVEAGAFYFSKNAKEFINFNRIVLLTVNKSGWWWFMDQFSLYISYEKFKTKLNIYKFDKNFINFDYTTKPIIFSAKGSKKNSQEFEYNRN